MAPVRATGPSLQVHGQSEERHDGVHADRPTSECVVAAPDGRPALSFAALHLFPQVAVTLGPSFQIHPAG